MHRFHLPPAHCQSGTLQLTGREAHHATHVLRIQCGETVTVLDGTGGEYLCEIQHCDRKQVQLGILRKTSTPPPPFLITLLQAIPKGKIMESIIQKGTELGVHRIVPLVTERVATRLDQEGADSKGSKWQQIAIEAIKQCGSAWLPRVETPTTPAEFLRRQESFELPLIASLQPGTRHPRVYFRKFEKEHSRPPQSVCIWIGPEGDFTPDEVGAIQAGGALPVTLGSLVLRVETAAICCLSFVNYELLAPVARD